MFTWKQKTIHKVQGQMVKTVSDFPFCLSLNLSLHLEAKQVCTSPMKPTTVGPHCKDSKQVETWKGVF